MSNAFKKILFLIVINLALGLLYLYYQPLCEPCLENTYCPLCVSKEQYMVIIAAVILNTLFLLAVFFRNKKLKIK